MKTLYCYPILLLLLLLAPFHSSAQTTQPFFYNQITASIQGYDGQNLLLLNSELSPAGLPVISIHEPQSDSLVKTAILFNDGIPLSLEVMPVSDGFLAAASFFQCDVYLDWQLYRFNQKGNLLWVKPLAFQTSPQDSMKILPGPGGGFWLFRNGEVPMLHTPHGELIQTGTHVLPLFTGYQESAGGKLLVYGDSGLALYSPTLLSIQVGLQNTIILDAEPLPNGNFAALSSDTLFLLDPQFTIIQKTALNLPANTLVDLTYAGGWTHVLAQTNPKQLLRFDTADLTIFAAIDIPQNAPFQVQFIACTPDDKLLLTGYEHPSRGQVLETRTVSATQMPDFSATADAGISSITINTPPKGTQYSGPILSYDIRINSISILLQNTGSAPLQQVDINGVLNTFMWYCGQEAAFYRKRFENLNLMPGEDSVLILGPVIWSAPWYLPSEIDLCFWTTLPNDSIDVNFANNQSCISTLVTTPAHSPQSVTKKINITPNPAYQIARIEWTNKKEEETTIQVFGPSGRLVRTATTQGKTWTLQRESLPAGLYTIFIRSGSGQQFMGRLVFQ